VPADVGLVTLDSFRELSTVVVSVPTVDGMSREGGSARLRWTNSSRLRGRPVSLRSAIVNGSSLRERTVDVSAVAAVDDSA
jgi:hypothetical protein